MCKVTVNDDDQQRPTSPLERLLMTAERDGTSREHLLWVVDQMMMRVKPADLTNQQIRELIAVLTPAHSRAITAEKAFGGRLLGTVAPTGRPPLSLVPRREAQADLVQ